MDLEKQDNSNEFALQLHNKLWMWEFDIRAEGCVHITSYSNGTKDEENRSYIHICELDDFIKTLQDIQLKAKEHFGEWPC